MRDLSAYVRVFLQACSHTAAELVVPNLACVHAAVLPGSSHCLAAVAAVHVPDVAPLLRL